jgi:hypothetical protein
MIHGQDFEASGKAFGESLLQAQACRAEEHHF